MCAKKRHRTSSNFLQYLKDDLSMQERHDLERGLEADPFEKEAMEGLENISPEKAEKDLLSLHASLRKRLGRRKRVAWYSIAATAASILIVGSIFLNIYELNPEEAERESLTEETFHSLDSDDKEAPPATRDQDHPGKAEALKYAKENAARATAPAPAQARNISPPEKQETEQNPLVMEDLEVMEFSMADENKSEVAAELVKKPENRREIVVIEAVPKETSGSSEKRSKSLSLENLPGQVPTREVSGIVVSSKDMNPLPGASIVIRGSNSGTVADMEGRFTLPMNDSQTTVVASFIGMETDEYQLNSENDNELVMQPDAQTLDEIMIVAQGKEKNETSPSYTPAEPVSGYRAFKKYMEQNMVFPGDYIPGEREVVILRFTVLSNGSFTDIQTLRTPGEPYTLEAIRLILEGPEWTPAHISSDPVDEQVRVRIVFKK